MCYSISCCWLFWEWFCSVSVTFQWMPHLVTAWVHIPTDKWQRSQKVLLNRWWSGTKFAFIIPENRCAVWLMLKKQQRVNSFQTNCICDKEWWKLEANLVFFSNCSGQQVYKGTSWNIIQTENCRIVPRLESHKLYSSLCVYQHRTASVLDPCCLLYNPLLVFKHLSGLLYGCASENLNLSLRWSFKADWIRCLF